MQNNSTAVAIGVLFLAAQAGAGTLINPGFETGSLLPWFTGAAATVTTAEAHSGLYSVSAAGADDVNQTFAAVPTADITELSFWEMNNAGFIFSSYTLFYSDTTSNGGLVSDFSPIGWEKFDVTSQLQAGKSLTGIKVFGTTPGPAYFDDFVLTGGTETPEPSTFVLLASAAGLILMRRYRPRISRYFATVSIPR